MRSTDFDLTNFNWQKIWNFTLKMTKWSALFFSAELPLFARNFRPTFVLKMKSTKIKRNLRFNFPRTEKYEKLFEQEISLLFISLKKVGKTEKYLNYFGGFNAICQIYSWFSAAARAEQRKDPFQHCQFGPISKFATNVKKGSPPILSFFKGVIDI